MSKKRNTSNDGDDPTKMNTVIDGISINGNKITNGHDGTAELNLSGRKMLRATATVLLPIFLLLNNQKSDSSQIWTQAPTPKPSPIMNRSLRCSPLDAVRIIAYYH